MNYFKVKTFFQIEYFKGWADKNPKPGYVYGPNFYVKSEKSEKELYLDVNNITKEKSPVSFRLSNVNSNSISITEEQLVKKLLGLSLSVCSHPIQDKEPNRNSEKHPISTDASNEIQDESEYSVYVTNATANNIAYQVCLLINQENGEIDITPKQEQTEYYLNLFTNQASEFITAYLRLTLHLDDFVDSLSIDDRIRFFKEKTKNKIKDRFRYIYHMDNECKLLHSDYKEGGVFRANTQVFDGYNIDSRFLKELGFRGCKVCCPGESSEDEEGYRYTTIYTTAEEWGF